MGPPIDEGLEADFSGLKLTSAGWSADLTVTVGGGGLNKSPGWAYIDMYIPAFLIDTRIESATLGPTKHSTLTSAFNFYCYGRVNAQQATS